MPENKQRPKSTSTAESFLGSIFKFSISTYINFGIYGVAILITGVFVPPEISGPVGLFISLSTTLMNVAILGLDQSFIRFFNEPPDKVSAKDLFGVCFTISSGFLIVLALVGTLVFPQQIMSFLKIDLHFNYIYLLFINAFLLMVARYFNVAYRMEQNIGMFTLQSVLMQFFAKLFYLVGAFMPNPLQAMVWCCVGGTAALVLVFTILRRKEILPSKAAFTHSVLKTVLPYGLALAPTAVLIYLNSSMSSLFILRSLGNYMQGIFSFTTTLSNTVTIVQAGFATFWGAYMFANYKTEQRRIRQVHDYLNFIILVFFTLLVMFQNIIFWLLPRYAEGLSIFPIMMLGAVFTILSEGTVYGIMIARKPVFDTIGITLSFISNLGLLFLLVPNYGLYGAAAALAISSFIMFLFRTVIAQAFYRTINYPFKTIAAISVCIITAYFGCIFAGDFLLKGLVCLAAIAVYCLLYRKEFARLITLGVDILKSLPGMLRKKGS